MITVLLVLALVLQGGSHSGSISGLILSRGGSPAAGVRVGAVVAGNRAGQDSGAGPMLSITQTDSSGRYVLENVPAGQYVIAVGRATFPTYYPGVSSRAEATAVTIAASAALTGIDFRIADRPLEFVSIPPGEFMMGCSPGDGGCATIEMPGHRVKLTKGFSIGKYEVTQGQWESVMGSNPSKTRDTDHPVEQISWIDVQGFLAKLNERNDGYRYRMPTEAEWEYAARAGQTGAYPEPQNNLGLPMTAVLSTAWVQGSSEHAVGELEPNAWGLYDMFGNVAEWVQDFFAPFDPNALTDPKGPASGERHVLRGGNFVYAASHARASYRTTGAPDLRSLMYGVRLVRELLP